MKNKCFFIACCFILTACGGPTGQKVMSDEMAQQVAEINNLLMQVDCMLQSGLETLPVENIQVLANINNTLTFEYNPQDMDSVAIVECEKIKKRIADTRKTLDEQLQAVVGIIRLQAYNEEKVLEQANTIPVYLERGDKLYYNVDAEKSVIVKIYNADSHKLLKTYKNKRIVNDSITIRYPGVYLVQITPSSRQYVAANISYAPSTLERILNPQTVESETVEARRGEFLTTTIKGVKMQNLFEEPRKFTLRGQLKAAFSGSYRAVVAIQVPKGATDILYSLRISTNEGNRSSDGEFYDDMQTSYKRVKMFGLPVYESEKGAGLISTLLGENQPVREEDAYINMYVFYNAAQAKKFQDGKDPASLSYNIDYSTLGTQSCNGRIPSKGYKTIYLGFLNERMRYNNYVWLEAVSAVPNTEYFKQKYTVK